MLRKENPVWLHVVLILGGFVMMVPFIWMILTAFKTPTEATQINPFVFFPTVWKTDSFAEVMRKFDFPQLYWNTILMIIGRVIFAVISSTAAGYAFGRLNFWGRDFLFTLVLLQMMVPAQIFIIPQYLMVQKMGMLNTTFSLVFPGMVSAFGAFLLRQFFRGLPRELEEASRLDGCNIGQTFILIMLPLVKSGMVALGIFTALFAYKDLMWPLIANTRQDSMPLSAALAKIQGQFSSNFPQLMAASLLACLPIVIIYILFQKQFMASIATTGGKL